MRNQVQEMSFVFLFLMSSDNNLILMSCPFQVINDAIKRCRNSFFLPSCSIFLSCVAITVIAIHLGNVLDVSILPE